LTLRPPCPPSAVRPRRWALFPFPRLLLVARSSPAPHLSGAKKVQDRPCAPLICKQITDLEEVLPPPCFPPHLRPQNFLLRLPSWAVLEQVLSCLHPTRTPPAPRRGTTLRRLEVLPCKTMTRLQLVKPAGQPFRAFPYCSVRPLFTRQPVLLCRDASLCPTPRFSPLLLSYLPLDVRQGSR
jgi:hypothetical protein